ncbi:SH3 domain protein [Anaerococcus hydrogenalis DSM 7454]|uniref:N-acetylmuramoyl-L-alanine amidase n=1 Tax=Anaerococcus hydrogenalis DSM 7454 TaxID=561177 RepID=B6WA00_9FIRM|nr:N-acetylmuramoyl-L-alanine amidase [Anaerococcus hydrogenalis]EEB35760.1 SH3 domain protein [Anaerococcus hydrogenalis DSM 7454]
MSNSSLVNRTDYSPNHSGTRKHSITKIAIHHTAGVLTAAGIGSVFKSTSRQASCNYGVGSDGKIVLVVDEANRAWTTSSAWCDNRAVTIETSNSQYGGNWPVSDFVLNRLIDLVTDICKRNNIYPCTYTGWKDGVLQKHEWYAQTTCPGPYLGSKFSYIANEVNKRLKGGNYTAKTVADLYRVRKSWSDSKSQKGAFKNLESAKSLAKKYNYKVYNKNGNQVWPEVKGSNKKGKLIKYEKWTGITLTECNVRTGPSLSSPVVACYEKNEPIHYDQVWEGDGYRWISYIGANSGQRRYVACRRLSGDTTPWIRF